MPKQIVLEKPWARHKAGAVLTVWEPGVELTADVVDPQRAAALVRSKLAAAIEEPAAESETAAAAEPAPKTKAKRSAAKSKAKE